MRKLSKLFIAVLAISALALFGATPVYAGDVFVGGQTSGDDSDVLLLIKCVGPDCTGTCTVAAATGVFSFVIAGANDTTVDASGVCGANTYQLDATDADCDTVGEFVDMLNASTNWRVVAIDAMRTDYLYSTSVKVVDKGATSAITAGGLAFYWDTSAMLHSSRALIPFAARKIEFYLSGTNLNPDPFKGYQMGLRYATSTASTCTAAGTFPVYQIRMTNSGTNGSEVVDTLFNPAASGTSAVTYDWSNTPIVADPNRKVLVRRSCGTGYVNTQLIALGQANSPK
jgi:hypothetical protein